LYNHIRMKTPKQLLIEILDTDAFTESDAAKIIGVSQPTVNRIINGNVKKVDSVVADKILKLHLKIFGE